MFCVCVVGPLMKMLMILGFTTMSPGCSFVPAEGCNDLMFMVNALDDDSDDIDSDD